MKTNNFSVKYKYFFLLFQFILSFFFLISLMIAFNPSDDNGIPTSFERKGETRILIFENSRNCIIIKS